MRRISVCDCPSLFSASEAIAKRFDIQRASLDYGVLRRQMASIRSQYGWGPSEMDLAIVSIDSKSDTQARFIAALERFGYTVDPVDFRHAFVSMPPGRQPGEDGERSVISVASRITFLAGLVARSSDAQLLVVSHSFEVFPALQELARRTPHGRVAIAYFSSLIDFRYRSTGILDRKGAPQGGVQFYDLEEALPELFGGASVQTIERHSGGEVYGKIGI
jgi:hypothetical protein